MPRARRALAASLIALTALAAQGRTARAEDVPCDPEWHDCTVDARALQWRWVIVHGHSRDWRRAELFHAGAPIEGPRLYDLLGRPDLAAASRARETTRTRLRVLAGLVAAAGLSTAVAIQVEDWNCGHVRACLERNFGVIGLATLGAVGAVAIFDASDVPLDPIPRADLARLIADYNRALPAVGAAALPSGGALVLRGGF
jgi:hypothetical protein